MQTPAKSLSKKTSNFSFAKLLCLLFGMINDLDFALFTVLFGLEWGRGERREGLVRENREREDRDDSIYVERR